MGRFSDALAAGMAAVARAEGRRATAAGLGAVALLVPGLSGARLSAALAAFAAQVPPGAPRVAIADHLPPDLDPRGARPAASPPAFEHLSAIDDLLAHASPTAARLHRVRRLRIILTRRGIVECLWAGAEAEEIVRAFMAEDLVRYHAPQPPLASGRTPVVAAIDPSPAVLFRPFALRD
ncbi:MAG: hypothetical protein MUF73_19185 [Rhodobacteraceae bacterium]|jgi:hypothetical protein|nr:hypothetical protein [Paracoccaceae bacterium]